MQHDIDEVLSKIKRAKAHAIIAFTLALIL